MCSNIQVCKAKLLQHDWLSLVEDGHETILESIFILEETTSHYGWIFPQALEFAACWHCNGKQDIHEQSEKIQSGMKFIENSSIICPLNFCRFILLPNFESKQSSFKSRFWTTMALQKCGWIAWKTGKKLCLILSLWRRLPVISRGLWLLERLTDRISADEPLFILAPIHIQLSYDKLVIPEKKWISAVSDNMLHFRQTRDGWVGHQHWNLLDVAGSGRSKFSTDLSNNSSIVGT